jgi:hypothetical protein
MIKIKPYFYDAPNELWQEASRSRNKSKNNPNRNSLIELALSQKSSHDFDRQAYALPVVKEKLKTIFNHKCAFCETNTHAGAHKDVEHYRYKNHYYWLGYEWSNLLLSCQICNRDFKGKKFPLLNESNRLINHPLSVLGELNKTQCFIKSKTLKSEKPLLLHPAIDNPIKHLRFLGNGLLEGRTAKGHISIDTYGLNRNELVLKRKKIALRILKKIINNYLLRIEELTQQEKPKWMEIVIMNTIEDIKTTIVDKTTEYIGFREAVIKNFKKLIINNQSLGIDIPDKEIMKKAVRRVLNG